MPRSLPYLQLAALLPAGLLGVRLPLARHAEGIRPPPAFYACEDEPPCPVPGYFQMAPSVRMPALLEHGYARMREISASGRRPLALHVGADGLRNDVKWTDVHLYGHVLGHSGVAAGALRLAFVEPVEDKAPEFWSRVGRLPVSRSQVSLSTAMLDGACLEEERSLYRISPKALRDFNMSRLAVGGWCSESKDYAFEVLKMWLSGDWSLPCYDNSGNCRGSWERFGSMPNLTDYREEIRVPCFTLAGLLEKLGAEVGDLAMLVVDAEEFDQAIIGPLASDPRFKPGFIMWEGPYQEGGPLHDLLLARGFKIGSKPGYSGRPGADAVNTVAVLPQP